MVHAGNADRDTLEMIVWVRYTYGAWEQCSERLCQSNVNALVQYRLELFLRVP